MIIQSAFSLAQSDSLFYIFSVQLGLAEIEWRASDVDELASRNQVSIDIDDFGTLDLESVSQGVIVAILETVEVAGQMS